MAMSWKRRYAGADSLESRLCRSSEIQAKEQGIDPARRYNWVLEEQPGLPSNPATPSFELRSVRRVQAVNQRRRYLIDFEYHGGAAGLTEIDEFMYATLHRRTTTTGLALKPATTMQLEIKRSATSRVWISGSLYKSLAGWVDSVSPATILALNETFPSHFYLSFRMDPPIYPPTKTIHCLPLEMLSLIIKLASNQCKGTSKTRHQLQHKCKKDPKEARDLTLINITHVCTIWRATAINDSSLWTHIDFSSPRSVPVFLERAHARPLHVALNTPQLSSRFVEAVSVFRGTTNIETLKLEVDFRTISSTLSHMQNASFRAPRLRKLSICSAECFYDVETALGFFGEIVPELQMLKLVHCRIIWPIAKFDGLRQLEIIHSPIMCSIRDFVGLLGQMPNLIRLELDSSLPRTASRPYYPQTQTTNLASLKYLCLGGTAPAVAQFIGSVHLPAAIEASVTVNADDHPEPHVFAIATCLTNIFSHSAPSDRIDMHLVQSQGSLCFQLEGIHCPSPNIEFVILANRPSPLMAPVAAIMAIPLVLDFRCNMSFFTAGDWLLSFGHLRHLRKIQLPRNMLGSLMVALCLRGYNGISGMPFPALQTIVVAKGEGRSPPNSTFAALVPQTLRYRTKKLRAPISLICHRASDSDPFLDYLKTQNVPHTELPYVSTD